MTTAKRRLDRIEDEIRFRSWLSARRMLETMTVEELDIYVATGQWPDRPDPVPGTTYLDAIDRGRLIKLWKEDLRQFAAVSAGLPLY